MRRLTTLLTGLGSLAAIAALTVGVPWALIRFVGYPDSLAAWQRLGGGLAAGRVDAQVVIVLLAAVVWVTWAQLTLGLLVETLATLRGRPAPRLPITPGTQRLAAQLVTSATLVLSTLGPARPALAADLAVLHTPVAAATAVAADPAAPEPAAPAQQVHAPPAAPSDAGPVYTVQRGDTLWEIAEQTLGDGSQWPRIRDLNAGRLQPDGTRLPADLVEGLRPGWTLALPSDAPSPALEATHVVAPGESLSEIAGDVYGDPGQYPRIFDANAGRPQADGDALTDPDVLHPGWRLDLPAAPGAAATPAPTPTAATAPPSEAPPSPDGDAAEPGDEVPAAPAPEAPVLLPDEQAPAPGRPGPAARADAPAAASPRPNGPAVTTETATTTDDGDVDLAVPAIAAASALTAGSVLWALTKMRSRQARRRRPGRDLPRPSPPLQQAERQLRSAAASQPIAWLDATLRLLTVRLRNQQRATPPPNPITIQVSHSRGVEVLLDRPDPDAPDGFVARDDANVWQLDPELSLEQLQAAAGNAPPLCPAMVTIGAGDDGPVLVNLEQLGVLRVEGPADGVQAFLAAATAELATAPWAASLTPVPLLVADPDDPVGQQPGVEPTTDLAALAERVSKQARALQSAVQPHTPTAARAQPDGEDWPPVVAVLPGPVADPTPLADLADLAQTSSVALLVSDPSMPATWRLQISDDGSATLEPTGLRVTAQGLDGKLAQAAAELLALADADDLTRPTPLVAGPDPDPGDPPADVDLPARPVEVTVLGPVTVTGWDTPTATRNKATEIVVYLATHDGPVTTDKLRSALWPEGVNASTAKNSVSRTRRVLGLNRDGSYRLPDATDGRYRLSDEVASDWQRFRRYTAAARTAPPAHAGALLRSALELVAGRPFHDVTWQWPFDEQIVSDIEVAVVDAAHRLAELAFDDDPQLAIWATRQGHRVTPDHEGLYRARMRAHAALGDLDGVDQAFREAQRAVHAYDPLDEVQPETGQLYQELTRRQQRARGA